MHTIFVDGIVTGFICVGISVGSDDRLLRLVDLDKSRMSQVLLPSHPLNVFLVACVLDRLAANYRLGRVDSMANTGVRHRANFGNLICRWAAQIVFYAFIMFDAKIVK